MNPFTGLSAFPLTPLRDDTVDETAYAGLIRRLADAGVDSITALGSTGSYAYLSREERRTALRIATENAGDVPVFAGIGALRTSHVRALAEDAQNAGVAGVLLAPMTYQTHTADDVYGLYADVTRDLSVPLIVYDNPGHHALHLHRRPLSADQRAAERRVHQDPRTARRSGRGRRAGCADQVPPPRPRDDRNLRRSGGSHRPDRGL